MTRQANIRIHRQGDKQISALQIEERPAAYVRTVPHDIIWLSYSRPVWTVLRALVVFPVRYLAVNIW